MSWTAPQPKKLAIPLTPGEKKKLEELQKKSDALKAADLEKQRKLAEQRYLAEIGKRAVIEQRKRSNSMLATMQEEVIRQQIADEHDRKRLLAEYEIMKAAEEKAKLKAELKRDHQHQVALAELDIMRREKEQRDAIDHYRALSAHNSPLLPAMRSPTHSPYSPIMNSFSPVMSHAPLAASHYSHSPLFVSQSYSQSHHVPVSTADLLSAASASKSHSRSKSGSFAAEHPTSASLFGTDATGHLAIPSQRPGHHRHASHGSALAFPHLSPRHSPLIPTLEYEGASRSRKSSAGFGNLGFSTPGGLDAVALAEALMMENAGEGKRSRNVSFSSHQSGAATPASGYQTPFR